MAKKVIVVRVGAKTIRIVHMDNTSVNPTVYGCVRVPTPEGAVQDGEVKNIMDVSRRIKQACQEKDIATKDVIFSLSSSKIANRETTIPLVKDSKIQGIVDAKIGDLFPIDKEKYIFSYVKQGEGRSAEENEEVTDGSENEKEEEQAEITDDTQKKKKKGFNITLGKKKEAEAPVVEKVLDLLVYAAPIDLVRSYYALAEGCDFNVVGIEVDGNGIFQIMRRQVKEGVEMAIQINGENTLINIMSQSKLLLQRVIPYGATNIIEAAMAEPVFQVPDYDRAVQLLATQKVLLHTLNASNPQNDLSMQKRIELTQSASSLIGNLYRVMEYYNSRYREQPIRAVIVTGNGAKIAGIHELMTNELGVPASTPNELSGVLFNRQIEVNANILSYVGCFGAVYSPVNFIPEEIKNKTASKESLKTVAAVFAVAVLICVAMIAFSIFRVTTAESANKSQQSVVASLKPIESRYNEMQQIRGEIATYKKIIGVVDTRNNKLRKVLDRIQTVVPDKFRIDSINTTEEGGTINCTTTDKLSSVAALVVRMNLITDIKNVNISSSVVEASDDVTKKRQYKYTITYEYLTYSEEAESLDLEYFPEAYGIEEGAQ